jgi:hypothetical protein
LNRSHYWLFLVCLVPLIRVNAQSPWILKKDRDHIRIYTRSAGDSRFNELRAVFDLRGNFAQLHAILQDIPHFKDWVYCTKSSVPVKRVSSGEMIYYSEVSVPWPLSNRDFYGDTKIWVDTVKNQLRVSSRNIDQVYPVKPGLVRIPYLRAEWVVSVASPGQLHVEYTLSWNPGGGVPAWMANLFSLNGPYQSFTQLTRKMTLLNP